MEHDFSFSFSSDQRKRFRSGDLVTEWRNRYPNLFDEDDERVLRTLEQRQYHFFEWLAAVLLYEATGYLSLVENYTAKSHAKKRFRLQQCLPAGLMEWLQENQAGQPDLFVYSSDLDDWYFCEVKGPNDKIRSNQEDWKNRLLQFLESAEISTEKRVRIFRLKEIQV